MTAVLVLALGIGASVRDLRLRRRRALIEPLPYPDPTRLVSVTESIPADRSAHANLSYPDYLDWKRQNTVFKSLTSTRAAVTCWPRRTGTEAGSGRAASATGFFRTLAVAPAARPGLPRRRGPAGRARDRDPQRSRPGRREFGGKRGRGRPEVLLSGVPHTDRRRASPEFPVRAPGAAEFWTTIDSAGPCEQRRSCHNLERDRPAQGGVSRRRRRCRREGHRRASSRTSTRTRTAARARACCRSRRSIVGRPPSRSARAARRGRAAAPDRVRRTWRACCWSGPRAGGRELASAALSAHPALRLVGQFVTGGSSCIVRRAAARPRLRLLGHAASHAARSRPT